MSSGTPGEPSIEREELLRVRGTVQGVGFRPFVARLATRFQLAGWVRNDQHGVTIRVRGKDADRQAFRLALAAEAPPAAHLAAVEQHPLEPQSSLPPVGSDFQILPSPAASGRRDAAVTPDIALCPDCRRELLDPGNRRHRYPFINCTNCGPRYSIVRELPYDRARTTMAAFPMCASCQDEYDDPRDRRYHAQPNACRQCGPGLQFFDAKGVLIASGEAALTAAVDALRDQRILAVKGIGGFHLMVDATEETVVRELRRRKHREEKPLAVMYRSTSELHKDATLDDTQAELLQSPAAPIVLVLHRMESRLAPSIAPGNPWIGALLPYTPLHVLLLETFERPVVATSANLSEEPLCFENDEALKRLAGIADGYLVHDRPIARPIDDSVTRFAGPAPILLRRARGYAPTPFQLPQSADNPTPTLCVGGHLKNTVAICAGGNLVVSPHIGDLSTPAALDLFRDTIRLLTRLFESEYEQVVCDAHPDYASSRFAQELGKPVITVQHHLAHVLACLLEHGGGPERVLGVAWDGTGWGDDETIWGGEFIVVDRTARRAERVGHLRTFRLPGGEAAIREPRRSALGALHASGLADGESFADKARAFGFTDAEAHVIAAALDRPVNAPVTSSAGRLFDAVAALLGLADRNTFEGQAAMAVEFAAASASSDAGDLPWSADRARDGSGRIIVDWAPALAAIRDRRAAGESAAELALSFHRTLAQAITHLAREIGIRDVALAGGCFQNAILTELTARTLREAGFRVLLHRDLPPNDNAIAAGQALGALWGITRTSI